MKSNSKHEIEFNLLMKQTLHEMYKNDLANNFDDKEMYNHILVTRAIIMPLSFNLTLLLNDNYNKESHIRLIEKVIYPVAIPTSVIEHHIEVARNTYEVVVLG